VWIVSECRGVPTLHTQDAFALRASAHKLDLGSVHFRGHDADEQRVRVLGPGDEVVCSAAQEAAIQRPEAGADRGQLHGDGELLPGECDAVRQAFLDVSTGFWRQPAKKTQKKE